MKNQFDELTKSLAQSVTRRAALKRFGVGLASMALACFGLANKSKAATFNGYCEAVSRPHELTKGNKWMLTGLCIIGKDPATGVCVSGSSSSCPAGEYVGNGKPSPCNIYWSNVRCSLSS